MIYAWLIMLWCPLTLTALFVRAPTSICRPFVPVSQFRSNLIRTRTTMTTNGNDGASSFPRVTTNSPAVVVDIYPHDTPLEELHKGEKQYRHTKYLHFIRHAQGTHNVNKEYRAMEHLDARLTDKGQQQCRALAATIPHERPYLFQTELVVTSPLTRCIQTTLLSLEPVLNHKNRGDDELPVVANEMVRETVNYNCDRRRSVAELAKEHPVVDFSHIETEHDPVWEHYEARLGDHQAYPGHRESAELHVVADRGRNFFAWLAQRPENRVVVCSHAAFLRCLWNYGHAPTVPLQPLQDLDTRKVVTDADGGDTSSNEPVVRYMDQEHGDSLKADFENCELRSMLVAFA